MSESPSQPRAKRQRVDKNGRFAALERLRGLKGNKNKCEVSETIDNVYDTVDEKEYNKLVTERAAQNWIEDDGTGFYDDGREIFDDEEFMEDKHETTSSKKGNKKRPRDEDSSNGKKKGSIADMLSRGVAKKKAVAVNLDDDNILSGLLEEAKNVSNEKIVLSTLNNRRSTKKQLDVDDEELAKQYMQSFTKKPKTERKTIVDTAADDELVVKELQAQATKKLPVATVKSSFDFSEPLVEDDFDDNLNAFEIDPIVEPDLKTNSVDIPKSVIKSESNKSTNKPEKDPPENGERSMNDFIKRPKVTTNNAMEEKEPKESKVEPTNIVEKLVLKQSEIETEKFKIGDLTEFFNDCEQDEDIVDIKQTVEAANEADTKFDSKSVVKFWCWDIVEEPKRPGEVFLFGAILIESGNSNKKYQSACVHVENIERSLFLLPREFSLDPITKEPTKKKVEVIDIRNEFTETVAAKVKLNDYGFKSVQKHFAFSVPGVKVPITTDYMEVRYTAKQPAPPETRVPYNTVAHIFGCNTGTLERFVLDSKIKGPCWLEIKNYKVEDRPKTWCPVELSCSKPEFVCLSEVKNQAPPPLVVVTLNVRVAVNPRTNKNEIVMIGCLVNSHFEIDKPAPLRKFNRHFCGVTRPSGTSWPLDIGDKIDKFTGTKVTKLDNERALLSWFLAQYKIIDPDLVVSHDANDCQLDMICERLNENKIPMAARIGRMRYSNLFGKKFISCFTGRMICDIKLSAEELIKSRSYDLGTLCTNVLKLEPDDRMDVSNDVMYSMFESGEGILNLVTLTMKDASYVLRIMCEMNVLPLALQITNVCGNVMSRTLQGGRSERNEFLLLHAFAEKNYIPPEKKVREYHRQQEQQTSESQQPDVTVGGKKKAAYSGGLVLEPKKGLYDNYILLMDFNSLYPSIIQEYNICFTTIGEPDIDGNLDLPESSVEQGVLPRQIRRLVESRREVKKLMANPDLDADLKMQYNIRQLALKLTANSMYGCLGFSHSRFFAQHLAALVTQKGREILTNTRSLVQKLNFDVIYGDTDSIMVNTNTTDYDQVYKYGYSIKQAVNKIYRQVELDIDGVFKYLLLLKKKKYAAVTVSKNKSGEFVYTQEHKGLDIVRRDWSRISVMAGHAVLDEILSDKQMDDKIDGIHSYLEQVKEKLLSGSVPQPLLGITKQLTKMPKDYVNITTLPHVQVALRMNFAHQRRFKKNDMVTYIICDDGTEQPAMQRAYHPDELKMREDLKVDINYYLAHQIHPVVSRLCEPLEGTDASKIASCLGLDPTKFRAAAQKVHRERVEDGAGEAIVKSMANKFRFCEKFRFNCVECSSEMLLASAVRREANSWIYILDKCVNPKCQMAPIQYLDFIRNRVQLVIGQYIGQFYQNWMICDDPLCNSNTRVLSPMLLHGRPLCHICQKGCLVRQYSETDLNNQLSYLQYIFDLSKHEDKQLPPNPEVQEAYNSLKETVDFYLDQSAYRIIRLSELFQTVKPEKMTDGDSTAQ